MKKLNTKRAHVALALFAAMGLSACSDSEPAASATATPSAQHASAETVPASAGEKVSLMHVHGLTYTPDGKYIYIPSHLGLAVYDHGAWSMAPGLLHDYMGFVGTSTAFYTSGHPAMGSNFINPFGLMKSTNGGMSWEKLGLEGETDFHHLSAGYNTNAIYVFNPGPNSKMDSAGLFSTTDDGKTWKKGKASGIDSEPFTLAAHPDDPKKVAIGGKAGLYVSKDAGDTFHKVLATKPITAVQYDLDGKRIWFATRDAASSLHVYDSSTEKSTEVNLPEGEGDPIGYIAQNPVDRNEYAMATFTRSVYVTKDAGKTWERIANLGETLSK